MARSTKTPKRSEAAKPKASPRRVRAKAAPAAADLETRLVDAALALAAERPWDEVTLADIAARAGAALAELHPRFAGRGRILAAFARRIDAEMLRGDGVDLAGERARDRLFDAVMRRFDLLAPYKDGLRSIAASTMRDPVAALAQVPALDRSMAWTLEAAGISAGGWRGRLKVRALGATYLAVLRIWLDDGVDQARTMAELDRRLARLDSLAERLGWAGGAAHAS
jgi:AcrR family transcriptional regulator